MSIDFTYIMVIFSIGLIGAFVSGLLGVGGSVINYPLLLFVPAALGVASFSAHQVSGMTAITVFFSTIGGLLAYRKGSCLNRKVILYMGSGILAGSFAGGLLSSGMTEQGINMIYGLLALVAVVMMMFPHAHNPDSEHAEPHVNPVLAGTLSFLIGMGAGIVGAGGAFLLVPVMLTVLKLPTRTAIASSLAITFLSSVGTAVSKLATGQVIWLPTLVLIAASLVASPLGAKLGQRMNTKVLEWALAVCIFLVAAKIWYDLLWTFL